VETVDPASIKIDREKSTLTFRPRVGKSLDPGAIHAALKPTRLGKNAGSILTYFQLTAVGPITGDKQLRLRVRGTDREFALAETPDAGLGGCTLLEKLRGELAKGRVDWEVTGYLNGWKGLFREVLKTEVPRVPTLQVIDFQIHKQPEVKAPECAAEPASP
jgi:hypothetical protein